MAQDDPLERTGFASKRLMILHILPVHFIRDSTSANSMAIALLTILPGPFQLPEATAQEGKDKCMVLDGSAGIPAFQPPSSWSHAARVYLR
jgi:hypothetical protein